MQKANVGIFALGLVLFVVPATAQECPGDLNGDGVVTIDEILAAVNSALNGCGVVATPTPDPNADLTAMIGRWGFTYTIINTFTDHLRLESVQMVSGVPTLVGTNLDDGFPVVINRPRDLGVDTPYNLGGLHVGTYVCDTYLFDQTGTTTVDGVYGISYTLVGGSCGSVQGVYTMHGTRTSPNPYAAALAPLAADLSAWKIDEMGENGNASMSGNAEALNRLLAVMQGAVGNVPRSMSPSPTPEHD